jgi:sulfite reductase (NADPH) flavoprotein alpha-component
LDANELVSVDGVTRPLKVWLSQHRELTRVARALVERLAALSGRRRACGPVEAGERRAPRAQFKVWQVPDLLQRYPAQWTGERLVRALHPLSPRLYSIASAPRGGG